MLTKTFHSIRGMFERLLNMYKEKSTRGLLALMAAFACGFIWPLLGLLAAAWTRHSGKHADAGSIAGMAAVINIVTYFIQIAARIVCGSI